MVASSPTPARGDRVRALGVPVIDLSRERSVVTDLIVRASEEFGFFMVVNHGISEDVISRMEAKASEFFALPASEKLRAGPATPLGYGSKTIGCAGDNGEVEYLLLHASLPSISHRAMNINRTDPANFSNVVNGYVESVRELTCQILELLGEGLGLGDTRVFGQLIRDTQNDSLLRMNHYPPCHSIISNNSISSKEECKSNRDGKARVGFGEHTDPQILTLLRSNAVSGLQVLFPSDGGVWVPVPPDPTAFCVFVGDILQVMTNGRLVSARHRAMVSPYSSRLSFVYFGAPPLNACISALPEMITAQSPRRYRTFTWSEFKKAMYTLRLGYNRLELFRTEVGEDDATLTQ